jgi:predicted acylesterase/phospholipase RssA
MQRPKFATALQYVAYVGAATILCLLATACTLDRLHAVPVADEGRVTVAGMSDIRFWGDESTPDLVRVGLEAYRREVAARETSGTRGPLPPAEFLAISGGGENGAFGAGLLVGWTAAGTRPSFKLVTGVSTGALIAPFAFLGPDYDAKLKEVYTTISGRDVLDTRWFTAALFGDALSDNAPLHKTVARFVDQAMLDAIAAEYAKGRLLIIGTTNLDARRPVVWNIGQLAASGNPKALELFRSILVASAAIPGAFPPTMIEVEVGGKAYEEMHVDGGATSQVFVYPPGLNIAELSRANRLVRERQLYVIRNARLDPDWADVDRRTLSISGRAISSLIQTQGAGDIYRIYLAAQRDHIDFNLAYIPSSFDVPLPQPFDTHYMNELFKLGYELAAKGYPWSKVPPSYTAPQTLPASGRHVSG